MKKKERYRRKKLLKFIFLFCIIIVLIFTLFMLKPYYKVENRQSDIKESKKNDLEGYETIGWIRVQGTNIDYPIIYGPGYDFNNKVDDFVWTEAKTKKPINKISIVGHNILNLSKNPIKTDESHSRFEQLMSFVYLDFVKENKYIQYTIDGEDYLYKVFSVSFVSEDSLNLYTRKNYSKKKLKQYINNSIQESIFDFDIEVNENDKIISLITCTRMYDGSYKHQFKVDARLVRDNELIKNYKVEKSKNYKDVENIMKGVNKNEKI